ncbi:MAG: Crp/Fnr family transcriptional regulator [Limnohabitans sp.]
MKKLPLSVRALPLFRELDEATYLALTSAVSYRNLSKGELLCSCDDPSSAIYILLKGQLQVFNLSREGQILGLNLLRSPVVFGELGVIDGLPRSADISAATAASVALIPRQVVLNVFTHDPKASQALLHHLVTMVRKVSRHQNILSMPSAHQRVCAVLADMVKQAPALSEGVVIDFPPHKVLASMVNTSRESVSRSLSQLQDLRILKKLGRRVLVEHPDRLMQEAGLC